MFHNQHVYPRNFSIFPTHGITASWKVFSTFTKMRGDTLLGRKLELECPAPEHMEA